MQPGTARRTDRASIPATARGSRGRQRGRPLTFDTLKLSLGDSALNPSLFAKLTSLSAFAEVDVLGYRSSDGALISETNFGLIAGTNVTIDQSGVTQFAAEYGSLDIQSYTAADNPLCYCGGTLIQTADGEVAIERLAIGDAVQTLHAGMQTIKWIGRRSYDGRFIAGNRDFLPVCIKRHAIAENVPARDLFVSPGHAICLDGALVHAIRLVNGVSITQAASVEYVTYDHIETENHEVILAEQCLAETFLDRGLRAQFQNAPEYEALYPGQKAAGVPRLPQLEGGFSLDAIWRRLSARAGIAAPSEAPGALRGFVDVLGPDVCSGWAQDMNNPETPVCLDILVDGARAARVLANFYRADLREAGMGSGCHAFRVALPPGCAGPLQARRVVDGAEFAWTDQARAAA